MPAPPGWGSLSLWAPLVRRAPGPLRARARAPGSAEAAPTASWKRRKRSHQGQEAITCDVSKISVHDGVAAAALLTLPITMHVAAAQREVTCDESQRARHTDALLLGLQGPRQPRSRKAERATEARRSRSAITAIIPCLVRDAHSNAGHARCG